MWFYIALKFFALIGLLSFFHLVFLAVMFSNIRRIHSDEIRR